MAQIKSVDLSISPIGTNGQKAEVTVAYRVAFTQADVGKRYGVRINLFGDDKLEGENPVNTAPQLLYSFLFGSPATNYQKLIAQPGEHVFSETRQVDAAILDEDPGTDTAWMPGNGYPFIPGHYITLPARDEVYAVVSLASGLFLKGWGKSEIVKGSFGKLAVAG